MRYVMGIDLGTSGTKTVIFDELGHLVAEAVREYDIIQNKDGWAEQRPGDWWEAAASTIKEVLEKSAIDNTAICGIGLSGQMHGLVMLDADGSPIRPSILWCDGRTGKECHEINSKIGLSRLIRISGNPALTGFTAGKVLWVREHEPENYDRCAMILLPKDYVRFKLTGKYGIDAGDASGTNLLDISLRNWSKEILEELDINRELLPPVAESCDIAGTVTEEAARITGLAIGTPVVYGSGDNASAAVGTGVVKEGLAFATIGTSGVVYAHTKNPHVDPQGRIHTFCSAVPGEYANLSCTLAAGMSLKWFKNALCSLEAEKAAKEELNIYAELDKLANNVPAGANGVIFLPYLMGERSPVLDEKCRGAFIGLSAMHTKADMLRAVLEGVAYSQRSNYEIMNGLGIQLHTMLVCGGGGTSPVWRQILADNFECPVFTIENAEGAALGAAIMAAVGVGIYPDIGTACETLVKYRGPQNPDARTRNRYRKMYSVYAGLYDALKGSFDALAEIRASYD